MQSDSDRIDILENALDCALGMLADTGIYDKNLPDEYLAMYTILHKKHDNISLENANKLIEQKLMELEYKFIQLMVENTEDIQ